MSDLSLSGLVLRIFYENWTVIFLSALTCQLVHWAADYISPLIFPSYNSLEKEKKLDWRVRVVSMAHAAFAICLIPGYLNPEPSLATYNETTGLWTYHHFGYSAQSQFFYSVSVGYFVWDVIVCIYYRWGLEFLLHGVLCSAVYFCCLYPFQHHWGRFYLGVYEISTIPLHVRGCLKLVNNVNTLFLVVQAIWVMTFFVCRILLGGYVTYHWYFEIQHLLDTNTCHSPYLCYFFLAINFSMVALMWYWWVLIFKGVLGFRTRRNDRQHMAEDQNGKKAPISHHNNKNSTDRSHRKEK